MHIQSLSFKRVLLLDSGEAGTGKTTFAQKLCAYVRSESKIALGCAATALASQVYINDYFVTAHELFKIPVVDDSDDIDSTNEILSKIKWGDERHTLLQETSLIIWDEFMSNHAHCLNAALKITDFFKGKVVVCMGDTRQIPPVVVRGSAAEVCLFSIMVFTSAR